MRGEPAGQPDAITEQHVADFLGVTAMAELAALLDATNLLERTGKAGGLPGELHGGSIGEALARPAHASLDQAAEKQADVTNDHCDQGSDEDGPGVPVAPASELEHLAADDR